MVGQQVDLVDVEHAAVSAGEQPGGKRVLTIAQHLLQIQRSHDAVLGGADRQFHQFRARIRLGQHRGQGPSSGRFGGALLAADQHAADLRAHRAQQQRKSQPVMTDEGAERVSRLVHECCILRIGTCGMPSSQNSSPSTTKPCRAYMSIR